MKITACVIVKNEEKNLPRWLDCMKKLTRDMVVVDTGSEDNTVEIAEKGGAKVFHFPWVGDFAKAKNFAIDHAKGDWILFLDADEYFTDEGCRTVLELLRKYDSVREVIGLMTLWVNLDADRGYRYINTGYQIRIFRNKPFLRYHGAVHEVLKSGAPYPTRMQFVKELSIYHTGYSEHIIHQKLQRNLEILLAEQKRRGHQPSDDYYLAECYYDMKDYKRTVEYIRKAIDEELVPVGRENRPYSILIQSLILLDAPREEIEKAVQMGLAKYPGTAEFRLLSAFGAWRGKDYLRAEAELNEGIAMSGKKKSETAVSLMVDETKNLIPTAYWYLGQLAAWKKDRQAAVELYVKALQMNKHRSEILQSLMRLLKGVDAIDVIEMLDALYEKKADASFLVPILMQTGHSKEALYYERLTDGMMTDFTRFFLAGRYEAAGALAVDEGMALSGLGYWLTETKNVPPAELSMLLPSKGEDEEKRQKNLRRVFS